MNKLKIFLFSTFFLLSINIFSQHYNFQNYTVEDGLAQSQVLSMCQDRKGNIWFGTNRGGVSRYDGNNFETISDSLINNVVYTIAELKNGSIIFGTNGGISVLTGKKIKNYMVGKEPLTNRIFKIIQDKNDIVWLGTGNGVYQYINNQIVSFDKDSILNKSSVFSMYADKENNIWFGTMENGLVKYNQSDNKFTYYNKLNGLKHNFVWCINEDNDGTIYVGTNPGLHKILKNGKLETIVVKGAEEDSFRSIIKSENGVLWFITQKGMYKYSSNQFKFYGEKNGLSGNSVFCALIDNEQNIWLAIHGVGVTKFTGETFLTFSQKDGLAGDDVHAIFQDSKNNTWFAIKGIGVCKIKNDVTTIYKVDENNKSKTLIDNDIQTICEDDAGNLYFGGLYRGISIFDGNTFHNLEEKDGLPSTHIFSLTKDHSGLIWIGTDKGLCYYKDKRVNVVNDLSKFIPANSNTPIYSIFEDTNNNLWLPVDDGVLMYNRKIVVKYNKNNGFTDKRVISAVQEANGCIWFGTNEGVFRYNHQTFKKFDTKDGLASNSVYFIEFDKLNNLWIGSTGGLDRLNVALYNATNKIDIKHFDKGDGLEGKEYNANAKFKDKQGRLWFGTIKGVTIYDPNYVRKNNQEAITSITGIRLFFENADEELLKNSDGVDSVTGLPINLVLPHNKNHISFDFIGVCLTDPGKVRYQTKLEGIDKDWFPATSNINVTYSSLPLGKYIFHVKAMNNDGVWNKNDVVYTFEILPPWYATWWFRIISVLVLVGFIVGFFYYRTASLRARQKQLELLVAERTSEVVLQKDEAEKQKEIAYSQRIIAEELKALAERQKHIVEQKQKEIVDSITYAKRIQTALLTSEEYIGENLPAEHFILFKPKDIVSGDFYWATNVTRIPGWDMGTNKKKLPSYDSLRNIFYIITGDCTGHGVPGAFMSMLNISFLNEIIVDHGKRLPHDILNEQRKSIIRALNPVGSNDETKDGMDCVLCAYDFDKMLLHFAAANNPLWLIRNNELTEFKADKMPVGKYLDNMPPFNLRTIELQKNDVIYTATDGYSDQFSESGQKLMKKRFKQELLNIHLLPLQMQKAHLSNFFEEWKGNEEQLDDVCVVGIRIS